MAKQTWQIFPKTKTGKWSFVLIIVMPVLFFIGSAFTNLLYQSVPSGDTILADIISRPALALTMLAGMASGCAACITGLLAIIIQKEKAILVYLSTVIGVLFVIYLGAEILFPH